jgi:23S rRNA (guanosine2251-2'-O)-methyltransferase
VRRVERQALDKQLREANHQGVMLETGPYPYVELDTCIELAKGRQQPPLLLLLDHLQDPQNIGTLLRTAEVVGVHGVALPGRRAAEVTPAVVNASSGATEHLQIVLVGNLAQTIVELQKQGVWVVGLEDDEAAQDFDGADLNMPLALVVGAEGPGLARLIRERCDFLVRLPMSGQIASLNAAVAGSIALYSAWRQRSR